jgi:serine/threonine protein kinase/WD40 repeat protein
MGDSDKKRNPIEELADSFLVRYRRGEHPSIAEFVTRHPELADEIRELFPALVVMEEIGKEDSAASPSAGRPRLPDPLTSEQIGDYRIVREIGRGGMGIVYEAVQESLGRQVALKVLPRRSAGDAICLARFRREARSAAGLHHTNIVPVFEVGESNGLHYYAMQLIQGQPLDLVLKELQRQRPEKGASSFSPSSMAELQELLSRREITRNLARSLSEGRFGCESAVEEKAASAPGDRPWTGNSPPAHASQPDAPSVEAIDAADRRGDSNLSPQSDSQFYRSVARIGLQVAEALAYAHGQRVLHRDIKPSNLLLDFQGTVWVTDFGLAKDESENLTRSGDIVGTVSYMAPERFQGVSETRSDVYSLGVTLYELLTLRPAFRESDRARLIQRVTGEEPPRPTRVDRRIPRDLETIVLKAMSKEPAQRYQSAEAMAEDLRRYLADRTILARRAALWERTWRWCRRNRATSALLATVSASVMIVTALSLFSAIRFRELAQQARQADLDTQAQLCESMLLQANASRTSQRPGQRVESLKALEKAARLNRTLGHGPDDLLRLRNEAIACLALPDVRLEQQWDGNPPGTNGLGFDASFARYAWSYREEGIRVRKLADHRELYLLPTPPSECISRWVLLDFSTDGRYLSAYYVQWAREHPLEVWDLGDGTGRRVVALPDVTARPAFAEDGKSLVAPLPNGEAAVIALPSGRELQRLSGGGPAETLALRPGGKLLAVAGGRSDGVRVLDFGTGSVVQRLSHPDAVQGVTWSADGKLLATACNDLRIHLWDAVTWREEGQLAGHRFEVGDVAFDPTGKWLASFGWDMTLRVWEVGSRRQVLHVEDIRVLGFRRQGGLAAAGVTGQQVQVWGFQPSDVFQEMHPFPTAYPSCEFSPDGRWLLAMAGNGVDLRIWDTESYSEIYRQQGLRCGWGRGTPSLLSPGADGFSRLEVLSRPEAHGMPHSFQVGQRRPLAGLREDVRVHDLCWIGTDGRRLLLVDPPGGRSPKSRVRLLELSAERIRVLWEDSKLNADSAATSRDGRWVAVGSYRGGDGVSVWETETGRRVCELPIGDAHMAFAADGRRLYTTTGRLSPRGAECRSWWVGSWESDRAAPLERASHSPAELGVAPDGTVAVVFTTSDVRLLDPETLAEVMTLSAPRPEVLQGVQISPDRTTLVASASGTLHLWNLRRLHRELVKLELDSTTGLQPPAPDTVPRK